MDQLEDLLFPHIEENGFATLALVSTGDNLREWTYYAESAADFIGRLNLALAGFPAFPIEIHDESDPDWDYYTRFIEGLQGTAVELQPHAAQPGVQR